jgi:hypothetical protein
VAKLPGDESLADGAVGTGMHSTEDSHLQRQPAVSVDLGAMTSRPYIVTSHGWRM